MNNTKKHSLIIIVAALALTAFAVAATLYAQSIYRHPHYCRAAGQQCTDRTFFLGRTIDGLTNIYTTAKDTSPVLLSWLNAGDHCRNLRAHGHDDWMLPPPEELGLLFVHRGALANLAPGNSVPAGPHWTSREHPDRLVLAAAISIRTADLAWLHKQNTLSVRCVRQTIPAEHQQVPGN
ncbi:MAG: hypothetical protein Q8P46_03160 [Hyphomicrobiales bacterium]|nr:hypothetical protein [Hyphomicrobiales bacterium]